MSSKYNFSEQVWEQLKKEIREILTDVARDQNVITYSQLTSKLSHRVEPHSFALAHLLGEVSTEEFNNYRPLLSALVVLQEEGVPAQGFYNLGTELGYNVQDEMAFWTIELKKVYQYYSHH